MTISENRYIIYVSDFRYHTQTREGKGAKTMKTECNITRKTFTTDDGKTREYTAYEIEIGGQTFSLVPRSEDKKLLNYILGQEGFFDEAKGA